MLFFLPMKDGPGFISTPDIIKSICVMLDKTNRYGNKIKDFVAFTKDALRLLHVNFFPAKIPILAQYNWYFLTTG